MRNFDAFLLDHAACERKASATALSLALHYADRSELVSAMIELAQEELAHFGQVYRHIERRGLIMAHDAKDAYVGQLRQLIRRGQDAYFLDRLLVAGVIEARGCERFGLLATALPEGELKDFYSDLYRSEGRHSALFVRLARQYFGAAEVKARLDELLKTEAELMLQLPARAALH